MRKLASRALVVGFIAAFAFPGTAISVYAGDHRVAKADHTDHSKDVKYSKNKKKEHENDKDKYNHKKEFRDHDDFVIKLDAGEDQVVNAGDKVHLKGTIKYGKSSNKYHSKKKFKDDLVIKWRQEIGTKVHLI